MTVQEGACIPNICFGSLDATVLKGKGGTEDPSEARTRVVCKSVCVLHRIQTHNFRPHVYISYHPTIHHL